MGDIKVATSRFQRFMDVVKLDMQMVDVTEEYARKRWRQMIHCSDPYKGQLKEEEGGGFHCSFFAVGSESCMQKIPPKT